MILLPGGENNVSVHWEYVGVGISNVWEALTTDNSISSYAKCDDLGESFQIDFANPSVAEGDIDTIDSVRFLSSGKSAHRSNVTRCSFKYYVPSGNADQNAIYPAHRTDFTTINGTPRTTSDGSSAAWTYANLEDLQMRCTLASTVEAYLSYFAVEVTYTEAVTANATFFGANF
jgi:hypothetical protein